MNDSEHKENDNRTTPGTIILAWRCLLFSYASLIALFTIDSLATLLRGAPVSVALFLWLFRIVPLLIFLPGLRRRSPRAIAWLSFVVLMYFIHAVMTAFVPGEALYGIVYSLLCVTLFSSVIAWIRLMRKHYDISLQT